MRRGLCLGHMVWVTHFCVSKFLTDSWEAIPILIDGHEDGLPELSAGRA